jgi:acyl-CoA hydrolase/L-amino acid N-acyltransferase YncA
MLHRTMDAPLKRPLAPPTANNVPEAMQCVAEVLAEARAAGRVPVLYLPGNAGRIAAVEDWVFDHATDLAHGQTLHLFQTLALGSPARWAQAVANGVVPVTPFIGPGVRALVNQGLARNIRCNLSQVHKLFQARWRPDVALAHVSPPDALGRVTLGLNAGLDISAVKSARYKVAVVNRLMPRWHIAELSDPETGRSFETGCAMRMDEFDLIVELSEPLLEHTMAVKPAGREAAGQIADRIIGLLARQADADGNLPHVMQLGIGMIPNAVAEALAEQRRTVAGVWSEMFSDGVLRLYRSGLIQRTGGQHLRDHVTVGFVLGTQALYDTLGQNPDFAVLPQELVNDPIMIAHNRRMASINATIAVSLNGEVAASTIGTRHHSDVGGQHDFALGASWSEGGIAIIALPSVASLRDGSQQSKVVATHAEGAHHTISADLPVVVVTEQGVADLRGLDDPERVEAMLQVAHPDWREELAKEARELPSMQGVGVIPARLVPLRSGGSAILRPATAADIPAIRHYIEALSEADRRTRYMGAISTAALVDDKRMERLYRHTLDYEVHAAFLLESGNTILGVVHAFRTTAPEVYEISFSRRSDQEGEGIGDHLMDMLIDWAMEAQVQMLHAVTYRHENPRMRHLFDLYGFKCEPDPDDHANVLYSAAVADLGARRRAAA